MSVKSKLTRLVMNSLSAETKWKLVKANSSIISKAFLSSLTHSRKGLLISGVVLAGVIAGVAAVRR